MADLDFILGSTRPDPTRTVDMSSFNKGLGDYEKQLQAEKQQEKQVRDQARGRMERAINQMQSVNNIEKVPPVYRGQLNEFLMAQKNKYYDATKMMAQAEPGSEQYIQAVEIMNSVNQSFRSLDNDLTTLASRKVDAIKDFDAGLVSNGTPVDDVNWLTHLYTDGIPMQISETGRLNFQRGDGYVSLDDAPDYFNRDSGSAKSIIDLNAKIYQNGIQNNPQAEQMVRMQVRQIVEQGGRETALSLAADDNIYPGGLGILDKDLLNNPSRTSELTQMVVDSYTKMIMESGIQGDKDRIKKSMSTRSPRSGGSSGGGATGNTKAPNSLTQEQLAKLSVEDIGVLNNTLKAIEADNPGKFEGLKYGGKTIKAAARTKNGGMAIEWEVDGKPYNYVLSMEEPAKLVQFIKENFTQLTGTQTNTAAGRQILFYLNAWEHKKLYGNEGGYNPSVGGLPVNNG
jgi:hypothetical protein